MQRNTKPLALLALGFSTLYPQANEFLRSWIFDRLLRFAEPALTPVQEFVLGYGWFIGCLLGAAYFWVGHEEIKYWLVKVRRAVNLYLLASIAFTACAVVAFGLYIWDVRFSNPIGWELGLDQILQHGITNGKFSLNGFYINGKAKRDVTLSAAYIQSMIDRNKKVPLYAGVSSRTDDVSRLNEIPADAVFAIYSYKPDTPSVPLSSDQFLASWRSFRFVTIANGYQYSRTFSDREVSTYVRGVEDKALPPVLPSLSWRPD